MRVVRLIARILLGLIFTVFGLNGFLHFLPNPPMSGPPAEFFINCRDERTRQFLSQIL